MAHNGSLSRPDLGDLGDWMGTVMRYRSEHPAALRILDTLERLLDVPYRTHALILGEPGTGKEGLARALHSAMNRGPEAPFVKIPSGGRDAGLLALHLFGTSDRPGAIDRAEGGTLYLDEVATLPREIQARLAPVLRGAYRRNDDETPRKCDVVVIGATDHDLFDRVATDEFRHDLYYRLARIELQVPPLRERKSDLPRAAIWAANRVLRQRRSMRSVVHFGDACGPDDMVLTEEAVEVLLAHPWRGNFRELDQVVERAVMLYARGRELGAAEVRAALCAPDMLPESV